MFMQERLHRGPGETDGLSEEVVRYLCGRTVQESRGGLLESEAVGRLLRGGGKI